MNAADLVPHAITLAIGLGGGGAGLTFLKDRRVAAATSDVAEQTVDLQVDVARLGNVDQQFAFVTKAWATERESLLATIAAERLEGERKDAKINELQARLERVQRELDGIREDLAEVHTSHPPKPHLSEQPTLPDAPLPEDN